MLLNLYALGQEQSLTNQLRYDLLSVKDGLPAASANAMIQDQHGYIWIGSFGGLSRYDGYSFKTFQYDKENPDSSLVNNYIRALYQDNDGFIWIGTMFKGLQRFDPVTETFITYPSGTSGQPGIMDQYITSITEDELGNKWVGTTNGLYRLSSPKGTYQNDDIELSHFCSKSYSDTLLQVLSTALTSDALIDGILEVGKSQTIKKKFTLTKSTNIVIAGSGEYGGNQAGMLDYGYLLSAEGDTLWNMDYVSTSTAPNRDHRSDHPFNRLKISVLPLAAGEYTLHYHSNDQHDFDQWSLPPLPAPYNMSKGDIPAYPELWGIQVFSFDTSYENWIKEQLHTSQYKSVLSGSTILDLHIDEHNDLWIATSGGFDKIVSHNGQDTIQHLQAVHNHSIASELDFVSSFYEKKNGEFLIHGHQLNPKAREYHLHIESIRIEPISNNASDIDLFFQSSSITEKGKILEDQAGNIWLTSHSEGLYQLVSSKTETEKMVLSKYPLTNEYSDLLFEDKSNILWVGVWKDGVYQFNPSISQFEFFPIPGSEQLRVTTFVEAGNGTIYIGTNDQGVFVWDPLKETLQPIATTLNIQEEVIGLVLTTTGQLFIGVNSMGIYQYDITSKSANRIFPSIQANKNAFNLRTIIGDNKDNLWISSQDGLYYYNMNTRQIQFFPETSKGLVEGADEMIIDEKNNLVLLGNLNGLHYLDLQRPNAYTDTSPATIHLKQEGVPNSITEDPTNGHLWFGHSRGLSLIDKETKKQLPFNSENLPPKLKIPHILSDDRGNLWLSTPEGIGKFNTETGAFNLFGTSYGIFLDEYNSGPSITTKNGKIIIGGINGFYQFDPSKVYTNSIPPIMHINRLAVQIKSEGKNVTNSQQLINLQQEVTLQHQQNSFEINYVGLHFDRAQDKDYAYRMIGLNDNWVEVGKERNARFNGVPHGSYRFEVKASNGDGVWNEDGTALDITILPPWWKTIWAYLLYILLSSGSILWLYRNQIRRIKLNNQLAFEQKEAERLVELDRLKTSFFSNITHEFRTPLTLIIEPARQLLKNWQGTKEEKNIQLIEKNSQQLLGLVNQLLDISKLEDKKMSVNLRKGDLSSTIDPIITSFQSLARNKDIQFIVKKSKLEECYFDKEKIEKILNNLLSNAFKFTEKGSIQLTIHPQQKDTQLKIVLKDTGIGIAKEQLPFIFDRFYQAESATSKNFIGTGIGLALTKELIELLDGSIQTNSVINEGSTFYITLPLLYELEAYSSHSSFQNPMESTILEASKLQMPVIETKFNAISSEKAIILLVEDNPELRDFIKQSLEDQYNVIEAENGVKGIALAKEHIPDIIISDVMMPLKDGYELCNTLKYDALTSHIPIILLTAKSAIESKLKGLTTGADAYLTKPFYTEELLVRIKKLIELRKNLQIKYSNMNLTKIHTPTSIEKVNSNSPRQIDTKPIKPLDQQFLERFTNLIADNIQDDQLSIENVAKKLFISRSQLHRKIKALTGSSPSEFIRNYRLDYSLELLKKESIKISQVASEVGFSDDKYFSRRFKERFGSSPSEFHKQNFSHETGGWE